MDFSAIPASRDLRYRQTYVSYVTYIYTSLFTQSVATKNDKEQQGCTVGTGCTRSTTA